MQNQKTKTSYSLIKVLTGSDLSSRKLALMQMESAPSGPVVWLTACIHGDEVGGIAIIQEIFKRLGGKGLLKGSLYAFPLMNPIGFENVTRSITVSEEDLNRSFPGKKNGSLAQRLTYTIFSSIKQTKPNLVLDLHNDWISSIPYTLIDPYPGKRHLEVYEKTKLYAQKTGFVIINEEEEGVGNKELKKSLSGSLLAHNIPSLTLEVGSSYSINHKDVINGLYSIFNILSYLGMTSPIENLSPYNIPIQLKNKILKYSHEPRCSTSGIIRFLEKPGVLLKRRQPVAKVFNVFGKEQEILVAPDDSIFLGHSDYSVALPGLEVLAFGIIK